MNNTEIQKAISQFCELRYNSILSAVEIKWQYEQQYRRINDRDINSLFFMCEENGTKIPLQQLYTYINSNKIAKYDPIRYYFDNLPVWDGRDYIKLLCNHIYVEEDKEFFQLMLRKWLIRAVKCALEDDFYNKQMLVFISNKQDIGKTYLCRWLCPPALKDYFTDTPSNGKDEILQTACSFLILHDEMAKFKSKDIDELKASLSRNSITVRLPYDKYPQVFPRRCSYLGTSNREMLLNDETGSVRFICFSVEHIDFNYSKTIDINKLYSQVYALYLAGDDYELTNAEKDIMQNSNDKYFIEMSEIDLVAKYFIPPANNADDDILYLSSSEIASFLQEKENVQINIINLGKALTKMHFQKIQKKVNGMPRYKYVLKTKQQ